MNYNKVTTMSGAWVSASRLSRAVFFFGSAQIGHKAKRSMAHQQWDRSVQQPHGQPHSLRQLASYFECDPAVAGAAELDSGVDEGAVGLLAAVMPMITETAPAASVQVHLALLCLSRKIVRRVGSFGENHASSTVNHAGNKNAHSATPTSRNDLCMPMASK